MPEDQTDLVPRPDPSKLTQDAFERAEKLFRHEIGNLRELLRAEAKGESNKNREKFHWLTKRVDEGVVQLRAHVQAEFRRVEEALTAVKRETALTHSASEIATNKSEVANDKRLEAIEKGIEAQFTDIRRAINDLSRQIAPLVGGNG